MRPSLHRILDVCAEEFVRFQQARLTVIGMAPLIVPAKRELHDGSRVLLDSGDLIQQTIHFVIHDRISCDSRGPFRFGLFQLGFQIADLVGKVRYFERSGFFCHLFGIPVVVIVVALVSVSITIRHLIHPRVRAVLLLTQVPESRLRNADVDIHSHLDLRVPLDGDVALGARDGDALAAGALVATLREVDLQRQLVAGDGCLDVVHDDSLFCLIVSLFLCRETHLPWLGIA